MGRWLKGTNADNPDAVVRGVWVLFSRISAYAFLYRSGNRPEFERKLETVLNAGTHPNRNLQEEWRMAQTLYGSGWDGFRKELITAVSRTASLARLEATCADFVRFGGTDISGQWIVVKISANFNGNRALGAAPKIQTLTPKEILRREKLKYKSAETRQKMALAASRRHHSPETVAKLRDAALAQWRKRRKDSAEQQKEVSAVIVKRAADRTDELETTAALRAVTTAESVLAGVVAGIQSPLSARDTATLNAVVETTILTAGANKNRKKLVIHKCNNGNTNGSSSKNTNEN